VSEWAGRESTGSAAVVAARLLRTVLRCMDRPSFVLQSIGRDRNLNAYYSVGCRFVGDLDYVGLEILIGFPLAEFG
jgi:hypothetical protein